MADFSLQQIFGLTPAVCSRYRKLGMILLLRCLKGMAKARLRWPKRSGMCRYSRPIRARHPLLTKAFGFVDGLYLPIARSSDLDMENAYYNGWCSSHYTSNILAFGPDGTIFHATMNAPGSWHDVAVSRFLYRHLLEDTPPNYYLAADTAFATSNQEIRDKLRTPPKAGFTGFSPNPTIALQQVAYNEQLVSAKQAAEWGMGTLQGSFFRLKLPMPAENAEYRQLLLETCVTLSDL